MTTEDKLVDKAGLKELVGELKKQGKRLVTTNGVFDIIHRGHVQYLEDARKKGDVLIVGLNSDSSVRRIKGEKRPLNSQHDRAVCLAALACVDHVTIFDEDDPRELLDIVKPVIHVKGGDYRGKEDSIIEKDIIESNGGEIVLVTMAEGYSTTALIERIKERYC